MSKTAPDHAIVEERKAEIRRTTTGALKRFEDAIKAGADEEQLLAQLFLIREPVQNHWLLLDILATGDADAFNGWRLVTPRPRPPSSIPPKRSIKKA